MSQCLWSCRTSAALGPDPVSPPAPLLMSSREASASRKAFAGRWVSAVPAGPLCSSCCSSGKQKHVQQRDFLEVKNISSKAQPSPTPLVSSTLRFLASQAPVSVTSLSPSSYLCACPWVLAPPRLMEGRGRPPPPQRCPRSFQSGTPPARSPADMKALVSSQVPADVSSSLSRC